jgi:hypothetical protein
MAEPKACPLMSCVVVMPPVEAHGYFSTATTRTVIVPCLEKECRFWGTSIPDFVDPKYVRNAEGCGFCKLVEVRKCEF